MKEKVVWPFVTRAGRRQTSRHRKRNPASAFNISIQKDKRLLDILIQKDKRHLNISIQKYKRHRDISIQKDILTSQPKMTKGFLTDQSKWILLPLFFWLPLCGLDWTKNWAWCNISIQEIRGHYFCLKIVYFLSVRSIAVESVHSCSALVRETHNTQNFLILLEKQAFLPTGH